MKKLLLIIVAALLCSCMTPRSFKSTMDAAPKVWADNGFQVIKPFGYEYGIFGTNGACVWYLVELAGNQYKGCVARFNESYRIYSLEIVKS